MEAMRGAAELAWANPSSVHAAGRRALAVLERTREALGKELGVDPRDVVFTSGGTEANNLALRHAPGIITSRIEHPSVVRVAEAAADSGTPVHWLPVPASGRIDPDSVSEPLRRMPRGTVVALMAVNHETGVIQPVREVSARAQAAGARLHVDAVQAFGKMGQEGWQGADSVSVAAHKLGGPKGIGALACRSGLELAPVLRGGAQERGLRPGTLDAVAAAGFLAALERVPSRVAQGARLERLRDELQRGVAGRAVVNGADAPRLPHVTNLSFFGWKGDELVAALDLLGVRVSSGSACSSGAAEPSSVITAMLGIERARASVRFSMGESTDADTVQTAIEALEQVLGRAAAS
jgi:cysteine desulfurase